MSSAAIAEIRCWSISPVETGALKVSKVLEQVDTYLRTGAGPGAVLPDSDDEDDDEDS